MVRYGIRNLRHRRRPLGTGNYPRFIAKAIVPAAMKAVGYGIGKKAANYAVGRKTNIANKIHQSAKRVGTGGSISKFYYGKRKVPKPFRRIIRGLSKNYSVINSAQRVAGSVGKQAVTTVLSMYTQSDMSTIAAYETGQATSKILHMSCSASVNITNQDVGNVYLDIYDIIARKDLSSTNTADPVSAWSHSYLDELGTNSDYQIVGVTPFSSDLFTQYFKVLKVTHCFLAQGESHNHRIYFRPNKLVDTEYVNNMQNGAKGITCFTMVVQRGAPYNDSTTKTTVSTGQTSMDYVLTKQYRFTYLADNNTTWHKTENIPSSFAVNESIMDIGTGAAVAGDTPA